VILRCSANRRGDEDCQVRCFAAKEDAELFIAESSGAYLS